MNPHYKTVNGVEFFTAPHESYRLGPRPVADKWADSMTPNQVVQQIYADCVREGCTRLPTISQGVKVVMEAYRHYKCRENKSKSISTWARQELKRFCFVVHTQVPYKGVEMRYAQFNPIKEETVKNANA